MVAFQDVVEVFHLTVPHCWWADAFFLELGDRLGQGGCFIGVDDPREPGYRVRPQGLGQETLGRSHIPFW